MSSDHRAGLFCVLYELMTMTSEGSTKESWISLLIEVLINTTSVSVV
jgi:hypothetical protein